jgi:hypothetical protein
MKMLPLLHRDGEAAQVDIRHQSVMFPRVRRQESAEGDAGLLTISMPLSVPGH